ncbi:MAG: hypothetical protein B7Y41_10075 [Hydrogenophilales bacterium 28-61-23]|nr:MAG: hypothetical protein B7Y41_10075 [Hydrogenophilales bacterium 28-61-23]
MSKRVSGTPRHPRSPVAKAVRTPVFKMRVVPDSEVVGGSAALRIRRAPGGYKRWSSKLKEAEQGGAADSGPEEKVDESEKTDPDPSQA